MRAVRVSHTIIDRFREVYAKLDLLIEYNLMLPAPKLPVPRKQIGFICRHFDPDCIAAIQKQYGSSIFITCGKSADLNNIQIDNYDGTIFTTSGINITATNNATVVQLPVETFDTHNYLAASDIIIAKAGWGTISEALFSKKNLVLIEREGVLEDTENIEELKRRGVAVSIKETDLACISSERIWIHIKIPWKISSASYNAKGVPHLRRGWPDRRRTFIQLHQL